MVYLNNNTEEQTVYIPRTEINTDIYTSSGEIDLTDYYTKEEVDELIENVEVDINLDGYATEQWVRQQGYVTDSDVNDYVGNEIGQLEEIINTKQDKLVSGTNLKTINGESLLGEGDITVGSGGSDGEQEVYLEELAYSMTVEQFERIYGLCQSGKTVLGNCGGGIFPLSILDYADKRYISFIEFRAGSIYYNYFELATDSSSVNRNVTKILNNNELYQYNNADDGDGYKMVFPSDIYGSFLQAVRTANANSLSPVSIDETNQVMTAILGDKLFIWDFINGEVEGSYCYPEIIDLTNHYTKEEIDATLGDINNILNTI